MSFYHYTSRLGAQDIIGSGYVRPGRGGLLYLTDVAYSDGAEAATKLSIVGKPVELRATVDLADAALSDPSVVESVRDGQGRILRSGGGREYTLASEVSAAGQAWFRLESP